MKVLVTQLGVIAYLMGVGYFSVAMGIPFAAALSLRRVWDVYSEPRPSEPPESLPKGVWPLYFVAITFWYNRRFGLLFLVGLVADIAFSRL